MSVSRYSTYKDSAVAWVGEVPHHWRIVPLLAVADEREDDNIGMKESNLLSLSYGQIVVKDINTNDGLLPESFETYQIVQPDDIVWRLTDLQNDKRSLRTAIVDQVGIITSAYLATKPKDISPKFLNYLLRAYDITKVFYSMGGGLRQSMKFSDVKRLPVIVPPASEQSFIVAFLDRETAKIDALADEQKELIELLKKKRRAVISNAVTKGLNPSTMVHSGVEWIGDVPEHWEIVALKHLVSKPIIDGPHESPIKRDEGIPFVSAEAVSQGSLDFDKKWGYISREDHAEYCKRYKPQRGDILLVKLGATTGTPAIVDTDTDFNIWVPLAAIRLKAEIEPHFILHVLQSDNLKIAYELNWTYGTQQTLGLRTISNLRVPLPPKEERQSIVEHLNSIIPPFELMAAEAQRAIDLLQERRSALIYAAVTGKIDVRGLVPVEAEAA